VAEELFPGVNPLGELIRVGDARTRVIGVLEPRGMQMGIDMDEIVIVPVMSTMRLFNRSSLFRIIVQVGAHAEIDAARERVIELIIERHGEEDVTCITQDSVSGGLVAILAALTLAIAGIAAISLSVAGIGIMNVMLVSVSERTPEVGLLRALGARRRQVLALFLVEAVVLSAAGALAGLAASLVVTRALGVWYPKFPVEAPLWAVGASLALSLAIGTLFGVLPARRASRLDPVAALGSK
jgi:putative ABC transport system permease protein